MSPFYVFRGMCATSIPREAAPRRRLAAANLFLFLIFACGAVELFRRICECARRFTAHIAAPPALFHFTFPRGEYAASISREAAHIHPLAAANLFCF